MGIFSKKHDEKEEKKGAKDAEVKVAKEKKEEKGGVISNREVKEEKARKYQNVKAHELIIKPLITEKAAFLGGANQYVFEVNKNANKAEVLKAIEHVYNVRPLKVNILNVKGKTTRYGRSVGRLKNWKKAVVTLKEGDKISVYEGV